MFNQHRKKSRECHLDRLLYLKYLYFNIYTGMLVCYFNYTVINKTSQATCILGTKIFDLLSPIFSKHTNFLHQFLYFREISANLVPIHIYRRPDDSNLPYSGFTQSCRVTSTTAVNKMQVRPQTCLQILIQILKETYTCVSGLSPM